MMSAAKSRDSGSSVGKNSTVQSQTFSSLQYGSKSSLRFVLKIARSPGFQTFYAKTSGTRTVQPESSRLSVSSCSLQGIAERPLPCNYNVIQFVCALSRRSPPGARIRNRFPDRVRCVLFVSFAIRCRSISPLFQRFSDTVHAGLLIVKLL